MKKIAFICVCFVISISCFALGYKEKSDQEEKRIENHILKNPNVISVQLKRNQEFRTWSAVINLINGGQINIKKCDEEGNNNGWIIFDQFGDYQVRSLCCIKESENGYPWKAASVSFNEILHIPFNNIDDFINNYDSIIEMLKKLAEESKSERIERWKMTYTDSDFLNYYGNYETDDLWGYVFACSYQDYLLEQNYWFYTP